MSVQRETMTEDLEQERPWEAHAWLRAETLAALAELNEQCLDMLALQYAASPGASAPLLVREAGPLLRSMDPATSWFSGWGVTRKLRDSPFFIRVCLTLARPGGSR